MAGLLLFQSTHPLRGATERRRQQHHDPRYFNPRTPCGVRRSLTRCPPASMRYFNPRTPCGVRPFRSHLQRPKRNISIHAPLAGCDIRVVRMPGRIGISIHAPLAGCDTPTDSRERPAARFQSTHPLRGATRQTAESDDLGPGYFNPRTPCGVRPVYLPAEPVFA